jgi:hypothetical protein
MLQYRHTLKPFGVPMDSDALTVISARDVRIMTAVSRARSALIAHHDAIADRTGAHLAIDLREQIDTLTEVLELLGADTPAPLPGAPAGPGDAADASA